MIWFLLATFIFIFIISLLNMYVSALLISLRAILLALVHPS
jgi:hypothetical protein